MSKVEQFKDLAKQYGFKILQDGDAYRLCAKNTDHRWTRWISYYPEKDTVSFFGNTDYLNIWLCDTRKDFTPEKCLKFVDDLNTLFELKGDDMFLVKELIDPEDWQEIAGVRDAYEDRHYSPDKKAVSIYKIDNSKLVKIGEEGYLPGQEQAKVYYETIPQNESFYIDILDENIKGKIAEMLSIDAEINREILFSVDNRDAGHISMTAYYLSTESKTAQHYVVSYANTDNESNYELANQILKYIENNSLSQITKISEISEDFTDSIISYAIQCLEKSSNILNGDETDKTNNSKYASWHEFSLSKEDCDATVNTMVENIKGDGIYNGSGYYGLKSFEYNNQKYNLYCEIFRDRDSTTSFYGLYYALEYDEGDNLWEDWTSTEALDINELQTKVFDIASADYTKDMQMHIDINDLNISEDIRGVLKDNRLTTLANIVKIGRDGLKLVPGLDDFSCSEVALCLAQMGIDLPKGYGKTDEIVKSIDKTRLTSNSSITVCTDYKELGETVWVNPAYPAVEPYKQEVVCVDIVYDNDASLQACDVENVYTTLDFWAESRFNALTLANAISEEYGIPIKNLIEKENTLNNIIADAIDKAEAEAIKNTEKECHALDI